MGFWGSLVHGVTSVTSWLSNNAGNIGQAAQVISQVAQVVALTEDELAEEGNNILPTLVSHLGVAENNLFEKANSLFPAPTLNPGQSFTTADLPGLWPTPSSAAHPQVIPDIGVDIDRFLTLNHIPTTSLPSTSTSVSSGSVLPEDVGEAIADQLFTPPAAASASSSGNILSNAVKIPLGINSYITGGMVYYQIPLGNPGSYQAWHSHIRLYYVYSSEDQKALKEEKRALAIQLNPNNGPPASTPFNTVTLNVQWLGSRGVAPIMQQAISSMLVANKDITLLPHALIDGTRYQYQFKTPVTTGPAQMAAALSTAIGNAMAPPDPTHPQPRMPAITVSNVQTYLS